MLNIKKHLEKITNRLRNMDSGLVSSAIGQVNANSYKDVPVTFNRTFSSSPFVVVSLVSSSTAPTMGRLSVSAINITKTGFTLRIFNSDSSGRSPYANWIAMAP